MNEMNTAAWVKKRAVEMGQSVFDTLLDMGICEFPVDELKKFKRLMKPGQIEVIVMRLDESEKLYDQQSRAAFDEKDFNRAAQLAGCAQAMNQRAAQWRTLLKARRGGLTPLRTDAAETPAGEGAELTAAPLKPNG